MTTCLECNNGFEKIAQHVKIVHKISYNDYVSKHGLPRICHCGSELPAPGNMKAETGHAGGRTRLHCSQECTQIATNCRTRGLDLQKYWELQEKGCAICGQKETARGKRMLSIDHDHDTNAIRGLLCCVCNRYRVGTNTIETARKVVEYLEAHSSK